MTQAEHELETEQDHLQDKLEKLEHQLREQLTAIKIMKQHSHDDDIVDVMNDEMDKVNREHRRADTTIDEIEGMAIRLDRFLEEKYRAELETEEQEEAYQHYRETGWSREKAQQKATREEE